MTVNDVINGLECHTNYLRVIGVELLVIFLATIIKRIKVDEEYKIMNLNKFNFTNTKIHEKSYK